MSTLIAVGPRAGQIGASKDISGSKRFPVIVSEGVGSAQPRDNTMVNCFAINFPSLKHFFQAELSVRLRAYATKCDANFLDDPLGTKGCRDANCYDGERALPK